LVAWRDGPSRQETKASGYSAFFVSFVSFA
jgi:hypothetical protein